MPRVDVTRRPFDNLTARRAGAVIALVTFVVGLAGGILMSAIDRNDFPTVKSGLWWSIQTITTVGYGDAVPTSDLGRLLAVLVMVTGLGFLSVVTAAISAAFVESARRRRGDDQGIALAHIVERLDRIERKLGEVDEPRR